MTLECVLVCPRTIRKLRSDPLGNFLDGYCDWLLDDGFSPVTIRNHLFKISHLNNYLKEKNVQLPLTAEDIKEFLKAYLSIAAKSQKPSEHRPHNIQWSINRFVKYLCHLQLYDPLIELPIFQPLLESYLKWMCDYRHAAPGTLARRSQSLKQFLKWLDSQATVAGMSTLTPGMVEHFFLSYAQNMGRSARRSMQSTLRTFFRFCLQQGFISQPLDSAIPTLRTYKLATVPRGLTDEQAQKVLKTISRHSNTGRRDYAICQILYTYGVRGGQVRALRLQDIDWAADQIFFKALKNGKSSLLPLTNEVGQSLLDYLQNSRPPSTYSEIFITVRAPYRPLLDSNTISSIISRNIIAAGVNCHSKGAHAFRHNFATRMLQKGHSLKEIADVLGHRHLGTTFIYTKVDFTILKQVGLAWPLEVI